MDYSTFIKILKKEVVPALGCTEPIAVALAAAKAVKVLNKKPEIMEIFVSRNILKNGMGVGIPGTGMTGLHIAAALGAVGGNAEAELEVLKDVTPQDIAIAKDMLSKEQVAIKLKTVPEKLYIEAVCKNGDDYSKVIIKDRHANIVLVQLNEQKIIEKQSEEAVEIVSEDINVELSVKEIYNFALNAPFEDIKFILEAAELNKKISEEGLIHSYGLSVGKNIHESVKKGLLSDDISSYAISVTAAASDARMAGCTYPVMSTAGSGNQGITATMPVVAVCEKLNLGEEKLARGLVLSNLITIHMKSFIGRLSALCGCGVAASTGSSCAITYLLGGELRNINYAIKNMIADVSGMICDGAKCGCALKIATAVSAAIQCAILAANNTEVSEHDGIIDECVEKTIRNLANIGNNGMVETDKVILDIMVCK